MKKFHLALSVAEIEQSIIEYSKRLGGPPTVIIPNEYALWRTDTLNFSIRRSGEGVGMLRHLGWEDSQALRFETEKDVNGVLWERFTSEQQAQEIEETWGQK